MPRLFRTRSAGGHREERADVHLVLLCSLWPTSKACQQRWRLGSIEPSSLSSDRKELKVSQVGNQLNTLAESIFAKIVNAVPADLHQGAIMNGTILVYGNEPTLVKTRGLILEKNRI